MMRFQALAKSIADPERMAISYLSAYFENERVSYPVNPFQMLKDEGVLFSMMDFAASRSDHPADVYICIRTSNAYTKI